MTLADRYPHLSDVDIARLRNELQRLAEAREADPRAVTEDIVKERTAVIDPDA